MAKSDGRAVDMPRETPEDVRAADRGRGLEARIEEARALAAGQEREVAEGRLDPEALQRTNEELERLEGMQHQVDAIGRGDADGLRNGRDAGPRTRDFPIRGTEAGEGEHEPEEERRRETLEEAAGHGEERDPVQAYLYQDMTDRDRDRLLADIAMERPDIARELPMERAEMLADRAERTGEAADEREALRAYRALPADQREDMRERHDFNGDGARERDGADDDGQDWQREDRALDVRPDSRDLERAYVYEDLTDEERRGIAAEIAEEDPSKARELPMERAEMLADRAERTGEAADEREALRAYRALPADQREDMRERHDFNGDGARERDGADDDGQDWQREDRALDVRPDSRDLERAYVYEDLTDEERRGIAAEIAEEDPSKARELPMERAEMLAQRASETQAPEDIREAARAYEALPWDQKMDMRERHDYGPAVEHELEASDDRELARVERDEGTIRSQVVVQGRETACEHPIERPARIDSEGEEEED